MKFPMSLDATQRTFTAVVTLGMVVAIGAVLVSPVPARGPIAAIMGGGLLLLFAFAPTALEVTDGEILVLRRLAPPVHLPLATIRDVVPESVGMSLRTFGVGGFFGSWGMFWKKGLGSYQGYLTGRGSALLLTRTAGLPIMVTPDDEAAFRSAVLGKLPKS